MARYAIVAPRVFGVSVGTLRGLAERLGRNHDLAAALWKTGWYEARMLASLVDEPARVTRAQMDRWSRRREEFVKRAAFALMASLALHDKRAPVVAAGHQPCGRAVG